MNPFLIAETPNAGPHGHRFLVPPECDWDDARIAEFIGRGRERAEWIGGNYIAVSRRATQHSTGRSADEVLVLVGIDTAKLTNADREQVVQRLRDLLAEVDAVAGAHKWNGEQGLVVRLPVLGVWLDSGFPALAARTAVNGPEELPDKPPPRVWRIWLVEAVLLAVVTIGIAELCRHVFRPGQP